MTVSGWVLTLRDELESSRRLSEKLIMRGHYELGAQEGSVLPIIMITPDIDSDKAEIEWLNQQTEILLVEPVYFGFEDATATAFPSGQSIGLKCGMPGDSI